MLKQTYQIQLPCPACPEGLIRPLPSVLSAVFSFIAISLLSQPLQVSPLYLPSASSQTAEDVRRA
nr:MAG TPA: hypothetical protein [Caudoviricetes sp.]